MKRLITSLVVSLGLVFVQLGSATAAPARFWKVDIFDPAASTVNRTLNVEYKVFSTLETDNNYDVKLLQNGSQVGSTQHISHAYGDSGIFSISMPATGSYKFKVIAENNVAGETKESAEKTVQVVDGPAPTVTTVFTNTGEANAAGGQGGGAVAAAAPAAAGGQAAGTATGGTTAGATDQGGQVGPGSAASDENKSDVLGAETKAAAASASRARRNWILGGGLALLGTAAAYYFLRMRSANE